MFHVKHFFIKFLPNILIIIDSAVKFCQFIAKLYINSETKMFHVKHFKISFLLEKVEINLMIKV